MRCGGRGCSSRCTWSRSASCRSRSQGSALHGAGQSRAPARVAGGPLLHFLTGLFPRPGPPARTRNGRRRLAGHAAVAGCLRAGAAGGLGGRGDARPSRQAALAVGVGVLVAGAAPQAGGPLPAPALAGRNGHVRRRDRDRGRRRPRRLAACGCGGWRPGRRGSSCCLRRSVAHTRCSATGAAGAGASARCLRRRRSLGYDRVASATRNPQTRPAPAS